MIKKIKNSICVLICLTVSGCFQASLNEQYMSNSSFQEISLGHSSKYSESKGLYCYQTIGNPDCYSEPQHGRERQLISYYPGENVQHHDIVTESLN